MEMRSGFFWLASLLAFPVAGAPLLLHPSFRRYGASARAVFAGAAGAFAITLVLVLATLAGWPWRLLPVVLVGTALCLLLRLVLPPVVPGNPVRSAGGTPGPVGWSALAIIVLALAAATAAAASASATSPDLLLFWGPKAEAFSAARGFDPEYLGDPLHRYQHVSYPPLVPAVYAFGAIAAGRFPWMGPVATFPLLLAALALALPGTLARFASRRDALVATAMIVASAGFLGDSLDIAGNADPALLLFEILAIAVLMGAPKGEPAPELLAGVLLGAAAAAKVEGLPFVLAAGSFHLLRRGGPGLVSTVGRGVRLFGPSAAFLGAWFAFGAMRGLFRGYESYGPLLEIHGSALPVALRTIATSLASAGWALAWTIPLAALLMAGRGVRSSNAIFPAAVAATLGVFFLFTYIHLADPTLLIGWSAGRIFMIVSCLLVLAALGATSASASDERRSG